VPYIVRAMRSKNGSRDHDHVHLGIVCHPKANTSYRLSGYNFRHSKDMKVDSKRRNRDYSVWLGSLKVISNVTIRYSIYN